MEKGNWEMGSVTRAVLEGSASFQFSIFYFPVLPILIICVPGFASLTTGSVVS
jgi:hypothetical protein